MKILILGASGFVGSCIKSVLQKNYSVFGTYKTANENFTGDNSMLRVDVDEPESVKRALDLSGADIVISSLRGVYQKQAEVHRRVANYLKAKKGKLIYISSLNAFDDITVRDRPHYENEQPKAESDYGKHKIECEDITRGILGENGIIIRIPPVYSKNCPRIKALYQAAKTKTPMCTCSNIYMNYTSNTQITAYITYIIDNDLRGIFHVGTSDIRDYYEFQLDLIRALDIPIPKFQVVKEEQKSVQAVFSNRTDIPDRLHITTDELIMSLKCDSFG